MVAAKIREYRDELRWSRAQMARRSGLSENVIENIETGRPDDAGERRRDVTVDELLAVATAFGVDPASLLPKPMPVDPSAKADAQARMGNAMAIIAREERTLDELTRQMGAVTRQMTVSRKMIEDHRSLIERIQAGYY